MVTLFLPDIPEFEPILTALQKQAEGEAGSLSIAPPRQGYWTVNAPDELRFNRKAMGLGPALWNSMLMGGVVGRIYQFDRSEIRIRPVAANGDQP